jgi:pimeloyl-ACP methyl ester carboxylesterase
MRFLADLAADEYGDCDELPPLVLLHGLTFDRGLWQPVLSELRRIDPRRRVLVLDLPGHGESPDWPSYEMSSVAEAVHRAVDQAQISSPILVGHSISAVVASVYAATYPTRGVVNVDQPLRVAPFAGLVKSLADRLRGPAFPEVWEMFQASMHIELLPEAAQRLVRASSRPRQDLVLGYWQEILDQPVDEVVAIAEAGLQAVRAANLPYLIVAGSEMEPGYTNWLTTVLPESRVTVWPGSSHFPHLAQPGHFAAALDAFPTPKVDTTTDPGAEIAPQPVS